MFCSASRSSRWDSACLPFQYRAVPIAEYESSAADLRAQAQLVDESTDKLSEDMKAQQDALREDISQGGDEGKELASELAAALSDNEDKTAQLEELRAENERLDNIVEETLAKRREYASRDPRAGGKGAGRRNGYQDLLPGRFDDGPARLTTQVLDKAKELGVHVTFFTSHEANESEDEPEMLRREFAEGHAVANHTYSHQFAAMGNLYQKTEGLIEMIQKQDEWVYECHRLPYGDLPLPRRLGVGQGAARHRPDRGRQGSGLRVDRMVVRRVR